MSQKKNHKFMVSAKLKQKMLNKRSAHDIGIEYNEQITSDEQYLNTLIQANALVPSHNWEQAYVERLHQLMLYSQLEDRKYLGSVVGIAILGFIGFVALGFSIIGIIAGGIVGGLLGSYAGKRIKKGRSGNSKDSKSKQLVHFDVFMIKLRCHLQICKEEIYINKTNCNLNGLRFYLDKTIDSMRPLTLLQKFKPKHAALLQKQIIQQLISIIKRNNIVFKALFLTYKLSKRLYQLKQRENLTPENLAALTTLGRSVLQPVVAITKVSSSSSSSGSKLSRLITKIERLSNEQDFQSLMDADQQKEENSQCLQAGKGLNQGQVNSFQKQLDFESQFIFNIDYFVEIMDMHVKLDDLNIYFMNQLNQILDREQNLQKEQQKQKHSPMSDHKKQENEHSAIKSHESLSNNKAKSVSSSQKNQRPNLIEIIKQGIEDEQNSKANSVKNDQQNKNNCADQSFRSGQGDNNFVAKELLKEDIKSQDNYRSSLDEQAQANQIYTNNQLQQVCNNEMASKLNNSDQLKQSPSPQQRKQKVDKSSIPSNSPKRLEIEVKQLPPSTPVNNQGQIIIEMPLEKKPSIQHNQTFQEKPQQDISLQFGQQVNISCNYIQECPVPIGKPLNDIINGSSSFQYTDDNDISEKLKQLMNFSEEEVDSWDKVTDKEQIKIYKKMLPENPCILIKGEAKLQGCTVDETFQQIYCMDLRKKWDKLSQDFRVVEKLSPGTDIIYFYVDAGFGVAKRDFLQKRAFRRDFPYQGCITILFFSIKHPKYPELKGFIRAESHISGYILKPVDNQENICTLTLVSQCDIKGMIPKSIVNYGSQRAPLKWIENLKQGVEMHRKNSSK